MDAETKGERAAEILASDVYQEAVKSAKQRLKDSWGSEVTPGGREALWHKLQAVDAMTRELAIIRDRGIVERTAREKKEPTHA